MAPRALIAEGQRFGRWVALRAQRPGEVLRGTLPCRCDCGAEREVRIQHLVYGASRSCGCLIGDTARTHGRSGTPEHNSWESMIQRCTNERCNSFSDYGGRGVTVCAGWRASFESFLADMGPRPDGCTLDRKDNAGGYWCGHCDECVALGHAANCRWATRLEQNGNSRKNRLVTFRGETLHVAAWARRLGVDRKTLADRLDRGWPVERALTTPASEET